MRRTGWPELQAVESSNIHSIGYDREREQMYVVFHSGWLYRYDRVQSRIFRRFLKAESKGGFLDQWIRDKYAYVRLMKLVVPVQQPDLQALLADSIKGLKAPKLATKK